MADVISNNPPQIDGIQKSESSLDVNSRAVLFGTILKYGLDDLEIAGILIDSYSKSAKYATSEEIIDQDGIVSGLRMADARVEISVSGRIKSNAASLVKAGAKLEINDETGVITEVSMSAGSKEFVKVDIKATCYEGITELKPKGIS